MGGHEDDGKTDAFLCQLDWKSRPLVPGSLTSRIRHRSVRQLGGEECGNGGIGASFKVTEPRRLTSVCAATSSSSMMWR